MQKLITGVNYKICSDCGKSYTEYGNKLPFCPTCNTVMQCLLIHKINQYHRWGVLPTNERESDFVRENV